MGTLKHNGKMISTIGEYQAVLKNKLYRPKRDATSLCLSLGSEGFFK